MNVIDSVETLRAANRTLDGNVGLVPTMGALHAGHLDLVERARCENDHVIVTIFINPTQFAPNEDLSRYPRDLEGDLRKLDSIGADIVFTPTPAMMYPTGYQTYITVETMTQGLEGDHRPGHFRGVATIVAKLFNIVQPSKAYFGQKDALQIGVIRRMVADLNFPLDVIVCPTVREPDGLAMSSRNVYLTDEERQAAPVLYRALQAAGATYESGERAPHQLILAAKQVLNAEPLAQIDYLALCDARTFEPVVTSTEAPLLVSMAVRFGGARLIDNMLLPFALNTQDGLQSTLGAVT